MTQNYCYDDIPLGIGQWIAAAFSHPEKFIGLSLNLASEEMTGNEMGRLFYSIRGKEAHNKSTYLHIPKFIMHILEEDIAIMAAWIERVGYGADLPKLSQLAGEIGLTMTPLSKWIESKIPARSNNYLILLIKH